MIGKNKGIVIGMFGLFLVLLLSFVFVYADIQSETTTVEFDEFSEYILNENAVFQNIVDYNEDVSSTLVLDSNNVVQEAHFGIGEGGTELEFPGFDKFYAPEGSKVDYYKNEAGDFVLEVDIPKEGAEAFELKSFDSDGEFLLKGEGLESVLGEGFSAPEGISYTSKDGFVLGKGQRMSYKGVEFKNDCSIPGYNVKVKVGDDLLSMGVDKSISHDDAVILIDKGTGEFVMRSGRTLDPGVNPQLSAEIGYNIIATLNERESGIKYFTSKNQVIDGVDILSDPRIVSTGRVSVINGNVKSNLDGDISVVKSTLKPLGEMSDLSIHYNPSKGVYDSFPNVGAVKGSSYGVFFSKTGTVSGFKYIRGFYDNKIIRKEPIKFTIHN